MPYENDVLMVIQIQNSDWIPIYTNLSLMIFRYWYPASSMMLITSDRDLIQKDWALQQLV